MHELHLAEDILRKIEEKAKSEGSSEISHIKVKIGQARFTHLDELKELLSAIVKETVAEPAKIDFEIIPLQSACAKCGQAFDARELRLDCAQCGSTDLRVVSGNELEIELV
jgi:hydrogenase nickel incorporation protein HypA/HybF